MNINSLSPKQARKREKIINIAVKLFVKHGIQGTSMKLLAKRADIATGSIYNYFSNKETLIRETFLHLSDEERRYILVGYDESLPVNERFQHLVRRSIRYKADNTDKMRFKAQYVHTAGIMDDIQSSEVFATHPLRKVGIDAQEQGLVKPMVLEELFYFLYGGMSGFINWRIHEQGSFTEEDVENVYLLIWDSVRNT